MQYKLIKSDSLLNKITSKDNLFAGDYTIDPYQNCEFGCLYCDSSYDKNIYVKTNADKVLDQELQSLPKGRIIVGSVHDPYQKAEEKYEITRNLLKTIKKHDFPCHILTKSELILRDLDILSEIKDCTITISIISLTNKIVDIFEKNTPSPMIRLKTLKKLSEGRIKTGIAIIPILPYITEKKDLENIIKAANQNKARFLLYKHLELKGDQKKKITETLKRFFPEIVKKYEELYSDSYIPKNQYTQNVKKSLFHLCKKYKINTKI